MNTDTEVPPIVLLVAVQDARDESHVATLEEAGLWVAESGSFADAFRDVVDLRPDVIVADLTANTLERQSREFVRTIKTSSATRAVPVVVLEAPGARAQLRELGPPDTRVTKPVSATALRDAVERTLAASRELRQRTGETRVDRRACPECGGPLDWVERRTVGSVEYDYYEWCARGCGLYCFELSMEQWLKLA